MRELLRVAAALRQIRSEAIERSAAELGLSVAEIADRRVRDLSGGMKQKLLAALALASDADLLICDEPTANLDSKARERFFAMVDARRDERALILCSHRADDVDRLVDRVVELQEGSVVSDTSIDLRYTSGVPACCEERLSC